MVSLNVMTRIKNGKRHRFGKQDTEKPKRMISSYIKVRKNYKSHGTANEID